MLLVSGVELRMLRLPTATTWILLTTALITFRIISAGTRQIQVLFTAVTRPRKDLGLVIFIYKKWSLEGGLCE